MAIRPTERGEGLRELAARMRQAQEQARHRRVRPREDEGPRRAEHRGRTGRPRGAREGLRAELRVRNERTAQRGGRGASRRERVRVETRHDQRRGRRVDVRA